MTMSKGIHLCQTTRRGGDFEDVLGFYSKATRGVEFQRTDNDDPHRAVLREGAFTSRRPDIVGNGPHAIVMSILHRIFMRVFCRKLNLPLGSPAARFARAGRDSHDGKRS